MRTGVLVTKRYKRVESYSGQVETVVNCPVVSKQFYESLEKGVRNKSELEGLSISNKGLKIKGVPDNQVCCGHCSYK